MMKTFLRKKYFGNHAVTVVDIPEKGLTLVLDPTNPGIGVVENGKIYMFSSSNGKGVEPRLLTDIVLSGAGETIKFIRASLNSYMPQNRINELEKIYGPEALNKELEYIKSLGLKEKEECVVPIVQVDEELAVQNAIKLPKKNTRDEVCK